MVIVSGTAGNAKSYSVRNGFTEAIELPISSADGVAGYKSADGSWEEPEINHNDPKRQVIIGFVVLTRTPYGRAVYAIGGNREAARLSGIKVDRYRISNFVLCSTLAGFAGIILASRVRSAWALAAQGWELDVIAAVIIGGTSLFGGRGGVIGTLIGALFLGVLRNGANLLGVSPFYQQILMGSLIVAAVVFDRLRQRRTT